MGGRGRGRGGGKPMSLNIEALGFGRGGDALPAASLQPPPTFPKLEQQPLPLEQSEKYNYLIDLKRYFKTFMEDSAYHVKRLEVKKDIVRYSDKYKASATTSSVEQAIIYSRMPEELKQRKGRVGKKKKPKVSKSAVQATIQALEKEEVSRAKAESGDEAAASDADKDEDDEEEGENLDDAEVDEEDMEEDNDYIQEYFDNGEAFGDGDDDGDDGPIY